MFGTRELYILLFQNNIAIQNNGWDKAVATTMLIIFMFSWYIQAVSKSLQCSNENTLMAGDLHTNAWCHLFSNIIYWDFEDRIMDAATSTLNKYAHPCCILFCNMLAYIYGLLKHELEIWWTAGGIVCK